MIQQQRIYGALRLTVGALGAYLLASALHRLITSASIAAVSAAILVVLWSNPTKNVRPEGWQLADLIAFAVLLAILPIHTLTPKELDYVLLALTILAGILQSVNSKFQAGGKILLRLVIMSLVVPPPFIGAQGGRVLGTLCTVGVAAMSIYAIGLLSPREARASRHSTTVDPRPFLKRPATRRGLQLSLAVGVSIVLGQWLFPRDSHWVVLSAFVIGAGAVSRGHVVMKGLERFLGAIAGTVIASVIAFAQVTSWRYPASIVLFSILCLAAYGRTYAYWIWALGVTLMISLLQAIEHVGTGSLDVRLLQTAIGSLCVILISYFVLPIRARDVFKKMARDAWKAAKTAADTLATEPGDYATTKQSVDAATRAFTSLQSAARSSGMIGPHRRNKPEVLVAIGDAVSSLQTLAAQDMTPTTADYQKLHHKLALARRVLQHMT